MTEFSFTKVGDSWSVRVWNGPLTNLAGQTVIVKTKAGAEKQVKFCGRCGDRLKNNLSRKLGTGPVCMKKLWSDKDRLRLTREAREELRSAGLDPDGKYDSLEVA
jgi:hypothetical protein